MWNKPWTLKEGFIVGAGVVAVGLLLHVCGGPVHWDAFAWPVNGVVLAAFLLLIGVVYALRRVFSAFRFLSTYAAAVPALAYVVLLTIIMGLTRQTPDGTGLSNMLSFWPFVLAYAYMTVILGLVIVQRVSLIVRGRSRRPWWREAGFLLNHVGLFVAMTTATLGSADIQRLQMWTTNNPEQAARLFAINMGSENAPQFSTYQYVAYDDQSRPVELPLAVELKHFVMETYDDGSPRRFASDVVIYSKASSHKYGATIEVNHPTEVDGWKIYQKSYYLTPLGDACQVSILELVTDPWLPYVYAGIFMMLAGALSMFTMGVKPTPARLSRFAQQRTPPKGRGLNAGLNSSDI